jgi:hypothetical protein
MAPDMRTTSDFILSQPKLHFAAHIRNVTPHAVSIPVPVGEIEAEPTFRPRSTRLIRWAASAFRCRLSTSTSRSTQPTPEDTDDW